MTTDPFFRVEVLSRTEHPQTLCWWAMHQDYSEGFVFDQDPPSEEEAGRIIVKHLLKGDRGHYGPLEHPSITFNVGWFPHDVMQQARTHRVATSFDVQSGRYTGQRILDLHKGKLCLDEVFYFRPIGSYVDRTGKKYEYTIDERRDDETVCEDLVDMYATKIANGFSEEHARQMIPYAIRQHFVVTFNMRSLMHFLDLRAKKDAQLEITQMCDLIWPHFKSWAPAVAEWYESTRLHKARLAP